MTYLVYTLQGEVHRWGALSGGDDRSLGGYDSSNNRIKAPKGKVITVDIVYLLF